MPRKRAEVYVLPLWMRNKVRSDEIDPWSIKIVSTVAKHDHDLSPFHLGPCKLYDHYVAQNMENAWQFAKVYPEHWSSRKEVPTANYWTWAINGWDDSHAHRYPMGRGRIPKGSWWEGELLGYIDARKKIYAPLYAEQVVKTERYAELQEDMKEYKTIVLLDYDAYDHRKEGMSLTDVLNNPKKKMGHAFVLAMLLTKDPALKQLDLRK